MRLVRSLVLLAAPTYALLVAGMVMGLVPLDPLTSVAVLAGFAVLMAVLVAGILVAVLTFALRAAIRACRAAPAAI